MKSCPHCGKTYNDRLTTCPDDKSNLVQISAGSDPMLGKLLAGRFLLTEKLGQGGMGAVYKALHTKIDRTCAIKLLPPFIADTESAAARFKREAKLASRIDNPHAVTIYDFGEAEGGMLYLAMEYIIGKSLSRMIERESPFEVERAVRITLQIASALSAAHKLGIVHRDLKPDNIMITRKEDDYDYVKVLDFGIAKAMSDIGADNLTETGFVMGTPVYMSPEQVAGEKLDSRSDIYSLAIIVYEMLSGQIPFQGDNLQAIMIRRLTRDPIRLRKVAPSVSDSIEREVMAGLARDRDTRTMDVKHFASRLTAALRQDTQSLETPDTDKITEKSPARIAFHPPPSAFVTDAATLLQNAQAPDLEQRYTTKISQKVLRRGKLNWKHYLAVAIVLIAIVGGSAALIKKNKGASPQPTFPEEPLKSEQPQFTPVAAGEPLVVRLEASGGDSSIQYWIDEAPKPTTITIKDGQAQDLTAQNQIRFNIGNKPVLKLKVNNRDAVFPPDMPKWGAKLIISRDKIQTYIEANTSAKEQKEASSKREIKKEGTGGLFDKMKKIFPEKGVQKKKEEEQKKEEKKKNIFRGFGKIFPKEGEQKKKEDEKKPPN